MTIDSYFFPGDKAVRHLGSLEQVLMRVFTPGSLVLVIEEMNLGSSTPISPVFINTELMRCGGQGNAKHGLRRTKK